MSKRYVYRDERGRFVSKDQAVIVETYIDGVRVRRAKKPRRKPKASRKAPRKAAKPKAPRKTAKPKASRKAPKPKAPRKTAKPKAPRKVAKPKAPRKTAKPKLPRVPKITYRYHDARGRFVSDPRDAVTVEYLKDGKVYAKKRLDEFRVEGEYETTTAEMRRKGRPHDGVTSVTRIWYPREETLRSVLVPLLRAAVREHLQYRSAIHGFGVLVEADIGIRAASTWFITGNWEDKRTRQVAYDNLTFRVLNSIRAMGGNTSDDGLKTSGTIGAAAMGFPLPDSYTITVWTF